MVDGSALFQVTGKQAEIWRPEDGSVVPSSFDIEDGRTAVPLRLEPWGSLFVVFRKAAQTNSSHIPAVRSTRLLSLAGPWSVRFQAGRGAPPSITMPNLADWTSNVDPGVRYFAGEAVYTRSISAPASWFRKGARFRINLGDVKNLAVISVNGKSIREVWHAPYEADVTSALKPGLNTLEITVVNSWVNRLIGDQQLNAHRYTYADIQRYDAASPLLPSGLLGPVTIDRIELQ